MAHFEILEEVRTGNTGEWQLCFQCGTYVYDPDQSTPVGHEFGYRFIYRRPNGQLQGARGQARLMPHLITILLGRAAEEGWYPIPPSDKRTPLASSPLPEVARLLRHEVQRLGDRARETLKGLALQGMLPPYEFVRAAPLITEIFGLIKEGCDLTRGLRGLRIAVADAEALRSGPEATAEDIEKAARAVARQADLVFPLLDDGTVAGVAREGGQK